MDNRHIPRMATLRITSQCNRDCDCCFAPKNIPEMSFQQWEQVFRLLADNGIKKVLLTGGEPLLRRDFNKMVRKLKMLGFNIFLDTNADFFFHHRIIICRYVDTIGLPIAFANGSWEEGNFDNVMLALEYLAKIDKRPVIRIGTVVVKQNIGELEAIGDLIKNYPVSIWKLYQFTPQAQNAIDNRHILEISEKQFISATRGAKKKFSRFFDVVISKRKDRSRAYFFIEPNGTVVMPVDDMNICRLNAISSIFDVDIFKKWEKQVSQKRYTNNVEATFRCKS